MPSSNKTPNIGLNQWQGNEYFKREDFNNDNSIIDKKIKEIEEATNNIKVPVTSVNNKTGAVTLTKTDVGLGNVINESKATMFNNAALTGTPTAPTAAKGTNNTQLATTAFVAAGLGDKQNKTDNALETTSKNLVGAINDLNNVKINNSEKGKPNGVAELDANGKIPLVVIPDMKLNASNVLTSRGDNLQTIIDNTNKGFDVIYSQNAKSITVTNISLNDYSYLMVSVGDYFSTISVNSERYSSPYSAADRAWVYISKTHIVMIAGDSYNYSKTYNVNLGDTVNINLELSTPVYGTTILGFY